MTRPVTNQTFATGLTPRRRFPSPGARVVALVLTLALAATAATLRLSLNPAAASVMPVWLVIPLPVATRLAGISAGIPDLAQHGATEDRANHGSRGLATRARCAEQSCQAVECDVIQRGYPSCNSATPFGVTEQR